MKTQLLLFILMLVSIKETISQSSDTQWLISNGKNKMGMNSGRNVYTTTTSQQFALNGVASPNTRITGARNDLFVIYNDGLHFNSRNQPLTAGISNFITGSTSINTIHNFSSPSGSTANYLYITNIYEEDDMPSGVSVSGNNPAGNTTAYQLTTTTGPIISANHDVVLSKDITVIINMGELKEKYPSQNKEYDIRLSYNGLEKITHHTHHAVIERDILDISSVFDNGSGGYNPVYPAAAFNGDNNEEIRIVDNNSPYVYVNFKPNSNASSYVPINLDTFKAVFTLKVNGTVIPEDLREPILHSHDPNFLRVDSISRISGGGYYIFYHLEFENTSRTPANSLEARVKFPEAFDATSVQALEWYAAGNRCSGNVRYNADSCFWLFDNATHGSLIICDTATIGGVRFPSDTTRCKGYVKFKVVVKPGYDVTNIENRLMLIHPQVSFDNIWFDLNKFYDLVRAKKNCLCYTKLYRPFTTDIKESWNQRCLLLWILIFILILIGLLLFIYRKRIFT